MAKIGKGETVLAQIHDGRGHTYYITTHDYETWYIYDETKKLGRGSSPAALEAKYVRMAEPTDEEKPEAEETTVSAFDLLAREHARLGITGQEAAEPGKTDSEAAEV